MGRGLINPHKGGNCRVLLTMGGDHVYFDGMTATQCASLLTTKIIMNSTISTPGVRFMTTDLKDFYYGIPM